MEKGFDGQMQCGGHAASPLNDGAATGQHTDEDQYGILFAAPQEHVHLAHGQVRLPVCRPKDSRWRGGCVGG